MSTFNFVNETKGDRTYVSCSIDNLNSIDSMTLGMMSNNDIVGLLHLDYSQINSVGVCRYNISSRIPFGQLLASPVKKNVILSIFENICTTLLSLDEFMISTDSVVLNVDYIYINVSDLDTGLICLPVVDDVNVNVGIDSFFKNILFSLKLDTSENVDYFAMLVNYINNPSAFSLIEFKDLVAKLKGSAPRSNGVVNSVPNVAVNNVVSQVSASNNVVSNNSVINNSSPVIPSAPQVTAPAASPVSTPVAPASNMPGSFPGAVPTPVAPVGNRQKANDVSKKIQELEAQIKPLDKDDDISLFYLLQHYNSDNNEKYKKAKEIKEHNAEITKKIKELQSGAGAVDTSSKQKKAKKNNSKPAPSAVSVGYAIPGSPASAVSPSVPSVSVPSMPTPSPVAPVGVSAVPSSAPIPASVPAPVTAPGNFGETTVLGGANTYGETTVLSGDLSAPSTPYLFRVTNNEKVYINKSIFKIGKDSSSCDYAIPNGAVSRSHATIFMKDNSYYLLDAGSTNHTYVNDAMIPNNQEVKLNDGDKVKFANEEFKFMIG